MPKKRSQKNAGLPMRWTQQHGAFYYRVPKGLEHHWDGKQMFRLGKTLPEAYQEYGRRIDQANTKQNVGGAIDRYMHEVAPAKAEKTYKENIKQSVKIRAVFGKMQPENITPQFIYQYFDKRAAKVAAKREIALLSHVLTKCVEWGYIQKHPFKGEVRLSAGKNRERYIEDWEIKEVLGLKPLPYCSTSTVQAFLCFAIVTGLRKQDILSLTTSGLKEDGIHVDTKKTGKPIVIEWTPALRKVTQQLIDNRPVDISPYLLCTKRGMAYNSSGWDSIWKRFMERAIEETKLQEKFTMHDLRAKCASDIDEEHANKLLAHSSLSTTKIYRRKAEKVRPGR